MQTAIIGGGLGGMSVAHALYDPGIDNVDIYESASAVAVTNTNAAVLLVWLAGDREAADWRTRHQPTRVDGTCLPIRNGGAPWPACMT